VRQPGASWARAAFYEFIRSSAAGLLRVLFGARGLGRENVPATGPLLLAANHQSYLDPPAISAMLPQRHTTFVAKAALFKVPGFAWLIGTLNSVPIRENQGDAAAIRETIRRLEGGHVVLIFPEGQRSPDGRVHDFKRGVALLMKKAKCPVVPVAITGAFEAWPRKQVLPVPWRKRVTVKYGTPIPYDELMKDGADAGLARIRVEVLKLLESIGGDVRPPEKPDAEEAAEGVSGPKAAPATGQAAGQE